MRYTHAGGIDEPLIVWKNDVGGWVPQRSWRGVYEAGAPVDATSSGVTWPGQSLDVFYAPDVRVTPVQASHWMGSLVEGKTDKSGLQYMRNRYYDPRTGRFTQEDPIGLAGGMNLYGFASGDPVNFSDPFGTCRVRVGHTKVLGAFRHAFVEVTAPDATATVFRGGPTAQSAGASATDTGKAYSGSSEVAAEANDGSGGPKTGGSALGAIHAVAWSKGEPQDRDSKGAVSYDQPLVDDDSDCGSYLDSFNATVGQINRAGIGYDPLTQNSNSVANQLLLNAGLGGLKANWRSPASARRLFP